MKVQKATSALRVFVNPENLNFQFASLMEGNQTPDMHKVWNLLGHHNQLDSKGLQQQGQS